MAIGKAKGIYAREIIFKLKILRKQLNLNKGLMRHIISQDKKKGLVADKDLSFFKRLI